jgi:hypothetical protein
MCGNGVGMPMTFRAVRKIALALDNVDKVTSYGTAAFNVRGALIAAEKSGTRGRAKGRPSGVS